MSMKKIKLINLIIPMSRRLLLSIPVLILSFSSVTPVAIGAGNSYNIIEVARTDIEVDRCGYLGKVWGSSDWGKSSRIARKHRAEDRALRMASELGATHLVWRENSMDTDYYPQASADAYQCVKGGKTGNIAKN